MEPGSLVELRERVCTLASRFDPARLDRDLAVRAVEEWSAIVNAAEAACAMAASRVADCGPPPSAGARSAEDFLARKTGTTAAKARRRAKTGTRLRSSERTREAATAGRLSGEQAETITEATASNPSAEDDLLDLARRASLSELREEAARKKAIGEDREATERRIHRARRLHRWREGDGTEHLHASGTKQAMAAIDRALAPLVEEQFDKASASGHRESHEAYLFDALVALAERGAPASTARREPVRHLTLVHVDLEALVRGTVEGDERCEIPGLGPISVGAARQLLGNSIVKLVITKGADVANVTHLGRGPTVAQKIALLWQQPQCTREGCPNRALIQVDHRIDWAETHHTRLCELDHLCWHCHALKTRHRWALVDGAGRRPMVPPDHPDHPRNPPPPADGSRHACAATRVRARSS